METYIIEREIMDNRYKAFWTKLNESGREEEDWRDGALAIMNEATKRPPEVPALTDEFWVRKIAVLSERCAKAERRQDAKGN